MSELTPAQKIAALEKLRALEKERAQLEEAEAFEEAPLTTKVAEGASRLFKGLDIGLGAPVTVPVISGVISDITGTPQEKILPPQEYKEALEDVTAPYGAQTETLPTGQEMLERAGVKRTALSEKLPGLFQGGPGPSAISAKGGPLDITSTGALGFLADIPRDLTLTGPLTTRIRQGLRKLIAREAPEKISKEAAKKTRMSVFESVQPKKAVDEMLSPPPPQDYLKEVGLKSKYEPVGPTYTPLDPEDVEGIIYPQTSRDQKIVSVRTDQFPQTETIRRTTPQTETTQLGTEVRQEPFIEMKETPIKTGEEIKYTPRQAPTQISVSPAAGTIAYKPPVEIDNILTRVSSPVTAGFKKGARLLYAAGVPSVSVEGSIRGKKNVADTFLKYDIVGTVPTIKRKSDRVATQLGKAKDSIITAAEQNGAVARLTDAISRGLSGIERFKLKEPELNAIKREIEERVYKRFPTGVSSLRDADELKTTFYKLATDRSFMPDVSVDAKKQIFNKIGLSLKDEVENTVDIFAGKGWGTEKLAQVNQDLGTILSASGKLTREAAKPISTQSLATPANVLTGLLAAGSLASPETRIPLLLAAGLTKGLSTPFGASRTAQAISKFSKYPETEVLLRRLGINQAIEEE